MNAATENLVLEMLRGIRGDMADMRAVQKEQSVRLAEIAAGLGGLRRDSALDAEVSAHLATRVDRAFDEIDRIKRRLDLTD
ncbi:MAG: hypothetical protein INF91_00625 [Alphaproteobacteria bacterium]|nr:hypothetical protein [Alphaproteobacteria bacterium]